MGVVEQTDGWQMVSGWHRVPYGTHSLEQRKRNQQLSSNKTGGKSSSCPHDGNLLTAVRKEEIPKNGNPISYPHKPSYV